MPTAAAYLEAKATTEALLTSLRAEDLARTCPSTPAWSIQDVVAHHVHATSDFLDGTFPAATYTAIVGGDEPERVLAAEERDAWTASGVEVRRGRPLPAIFAEWDELVAGIDDRGAGMVLDLGMHLADIAEAIGAADVVSLRVAEESILGWYHAFVVPRLAVAGTAVALVATDSGRRWGSSSIPTVAGTTYDLLRTIGGRRTRAEADALLDWGQSADDVRDLLPVYGWPG